MKLLAALLLVVACTVEARPRAIYRNGSRRPFIVGGKVSAKGRWPWQLSLQGPSILSGEFRHTCGASLLSKDWALTASHCIMISIPSTMRLAAGAFRIAPTQDADQFLNIEKGIMHDDFDLTIPGLPHDIALLKLATVPDLSNKNIATVSLPSGKSDFSGNKDCWITGWGKTSGDSSEASPVLMELNIPCMTNERCDKLWKESIIGHLHPILKYHICVGDDEGTIGACHGDSGGPLTCKEDGKFVVAGVTSRGYPTCSGYPSVYTRVTEYNEWIKSKTGI